MDTLGPSSSKVIQRQQSRSISISRCKASALASLTTRRSPPGISARSTRAVLNSFRHDEVVSLSSSCERVHAMVSDVARKVSTGHLLRV
jgi:hypothetical protein